MKVQDTEGIVIYDTEAGSGLITFGAFTVAVPTTANKFSANCFLLGNNNKIYSNTGTSASPSFQDVNEINTGEIADGAITAVKLATASIGTVARTATATVAGDTTGTLTAGLQYVTVTSDDANKIIILPPPIVGTSVTLNVGATGFELRTTSPTTIAINGGTGANAESAIPANSTCFLTCVSTTAWKGFYMDADGDVAKIEAAA